MSKKLAPASLEPKGILVTRSRESSTSSGETLRSPRTPRFAEDTTVNSPIDAPLGGNPFKGPPPIDTKHVVPQPQVGDFGFGYMSSDIKQTTVEVPLTPKTPMKSAMKSAMKSSKPPGTPGRFVDPRSPTFKEEVALEEEEAKTDKENAKDLKVKKRVRIAKFFLRGVNFSCSLIILSMLSATFTIFNASKGLPLRGNLPAWAPKQQIWPQVLLLCLASVSLFICVIIFYSYWRGGHRRAQKTAVYYTMFAIGFFIFTTVMWIVAAVIMHHSRATGNNQDMWGWACNNSKRETVFKDTVNYALICRMQNWTLICALIEIIVEVITITIYGIVAYRIISKRKLFKTMNKRDKARSDLYLAQLRMQSAPNTPGLKTSMANAFGRDIHDPHDAAEKGVAPELEAEEEAEWARRREQALASGQVQEQQLSVPQETIREHGPMSPGEKKFDTVPIPGAY